MPRIPRPEPVEIEVPGKHVTVRGLWWPGSDHAIVLVHEPGADVDSWGTLPDELASEGYAVLAIDLPGHGLSDGTWHVVLLDPTVAAAQEAAVERGARTVFLIAAGLAASAGVLGFRARVAIAPQLPESPSLSSRLPVMPTLILVGADHAEREAAQAFFRRATGWAVLSTFGGDRGGVSLLDGAWRAQVREQIRAFLADYRLSSPASVRR